MDTCNFQLLQILDLRCDMMRHVSQTLRIGWGHVGEADEMLRKFERGQQRRVENQNVPEVGIGRDVLNRESSFALVTMRSGLGPFDLIQ